jgi:ADP-ribose pyrophosphatase YjhB (NUDIX family)
LTRSKEPQLPTNGEPAYGQGARQARGVASVPTGEVALDPETFRELRRRIGYPDVPVPLVRDWAALPPGYAPVEYTAVSVRRAVPDLAAVWRRVAELSLCPRVPRDPVTGRPLNPAGPTGISGRGRLWWLGPNPTADAAVTRGAGAAVRVLLVRRRDTGQWAFPGGFAESLPGGGAEDPLTGAVRETAEETGIDVRGFEVRLLHRGIAARSLRNTDNAWIENRAFHFHLPEAAARAVRPRAMDDAAEVGWFALRDVDPAAMSDTHAANIRRLRRIPGL